MRCFNCNMENPSDSEFCQYCGEKISLPIEQNNDEVIKNNKLKIGYCGKCGKEILNDSKFCNKCGNEITEILFVCQNCGSKLSKESIYCKECGKKVVDTNFIKCQKCNIENSHRNKFCIYCGHKLRQPKKVKESTILITVVIFIAILIIGVIVNRTNHHTVSWENIKSTGNFTLSDLKSTGDLYNNNYEIIGSLKNNTSNNYKNVILTFYIYDKDGKYLGEAKSIHVSYYELKAHETYNFTADSSDVVYDKTYKYKLIEIEYR